MTGGRPPKLGRDESDEFSVLIKTLRDTDQRLEELTSGEVDTVVDREGRSFLLHRAQDEFRDSEAAKQAAILDALPAHVALLDMRGISGTSEGLLASVRAALAGDADVSALPFRIGLAANPFAALLLRRVQNAWLAGCRCSCCPLAA